MPLKKLYFNIYSICLRCSKISQQFIDDQPEGKKKTR
jgi:hypothetical protein